MYWKYFIRENEVERIEIKNRRHKTNTKPTDGDEIKRFYEELTKNSSQTSQKQPKKPKTIEKTSKMTKTPLNANKLFEWAQNNDVNRLKILIKSGFDINATDSYGWSALMCACAGGAIDCVLFLVQNGANVNLKDKSGRNALEIAVKSGNRNLTKYLDTRKGETGTQNEKLRFQTQKSFFCQVCDEKFVKTSQKKHKTSIIHLLSSKPKPKCDANYEITEKNIGFRLLLKDGWDRGKGLGVNEDGRKYPVKTVLKRDRKGFGGKSENKARITHFTPGDIKAVENVYSKNTRKTTTKSQRRRVENLKERIEKRKEKKFRRFFNE